MNEKQRTFKASERSADPPSHANLSSITLADRIYDSLPKIIYVAACLLVLGIISAFAGLRSTIVRVNDSERTRTVLTTKSSLDDLVELMDVKAEEGDRIVSTSFRDNYRDITVLKSFPVDVTADGQVTRTNLTEGTVADVLDSAGIELDENDFTRPSLNSIVRDGDSVRVYRVEYRDETYEETVPYSTTYKYSSLLFKRKSRTYTLQEGKNGTNRVTYRERYVDGENVLSLVSKVEVVTKPTDRLILAYGNEPVSPLSGPRGVTVVNGVPTGYSRVLSNVYATGYYSATGRGSSRLGLFYGSCAVNPNIIPYGTKMYIVSTDGRFIYGWAIATDTGTAVMEGIIGVDLFYETYLESYLNGKIPVNIYIYG